MSLAQRIRDNVARSRRNTAEILGVTAELIEEREKLLSAITPPLLALKGELWSVDRMREDFGNFRGAQKHFARLYGVQCRSWNALIDKVNTIEAALIHLGY